MKIHLHTPSFFPRLVGMTYATHVHAELLSALGADVTVVAPSDPDASSDNLGYAVRRFDVAGSGLPWNPVRGDINALMAWTASERPDVVIAEGWFTTGASLLRKLKPHTRHLVLSSHGSADLSVERRTPSHIGRAMLYRWNEATHSRAVTSVLSAAIVLSAFEDRDRFQDVRRFRQHGIPMFVCPNSSTYMVAEKQGFDVGKVGIIHVGEMKPHKNQVQAVNTLAALPRNFGLTLIYPGATDYLTEVLGLADKLKVRDRLTLVEGKNRAALEPTFAAADLLLITSHSKEAQPIVAVDAMAKGLPFVSTKVGCMPEFEGGLIAPAEELASAVQTICQSGETYMHFSKAATHYSRERLSRDRALHSIQSLLDHLRA